MPHAPRSLTALPVFNEAKHVNEVLDLVVQHADDVLVVDDGSTDGTSELLVRRNDVQVVTHKQNRGYGAALQTAFDEAARQCYEVLVTIDCDGQHEPQLIRKLIAECGRGYQADADIVSGSRYLDTPADVGQVAPADRRRVNRTITAELNERFNLSITDAFCGFKAYRVATLKKLHLTESGYAMPLELWVQAARRGLSIREVPVPLIYLDEDRSFGGVLDDTRERLAYYRRVIDQAAAAAPAAVDAPADASACSVDAIASM